MPRHDRTAGIERSELDRRHCIEERQLGAVRDGLSERGRQKGDHVVQQLGKLYVTVDSAVIAGHRALGRIGQPKVAPRSSPGIDSTQGRGLKGKPPPTVSQTDGFDW